MGIVLSADLGTTKITALAVDTATGRVLSKAAAPNTAERTSPADKARGYSEWDIRAMADLAAECLQNVVTGIGNRRTEVAGIGITGQQHGVVVVDQDYTPLTPFINWQDRRGDEAFPYNSGKSFVEHLQQRIGLDAARRTGCLLATGYLGVTLFWLQEKGQLPPRGSACFATDYFGALLTGQPPVTDPTCAASSGVFNAATNQWDDASIEASALPRSLFGPVKHSGERLGSLTSQAAQMLGLNSGVPVFVGMGDNQASFLGSVAQRDASLLVNVGTGGQVAAFTRTFQYQPALETRPFPRGGFLLVSAGLSGGAAYAVLERFFRAVGRDFFGMAGDQSLYVAMNALAASVPQGADGMCCLPFFAGTRLQPSLRAAWTGVSTNNLTPAHLARALLEGMAWTFHGGASRILQALNTPREQLIGAGNGLRENGLLAQILSSEFGGPVQIAEHPEEAAYGAALLAAVSAGLLPDFAAAGALIRYGEAPW